MKWTSVVSESARFDEALDETTDRLAARLGDTPDLLLAFVSSHHADHWSALPRALDERFEDVPLLGCSAGGVIGGGRELEHRPGLSLAGAVLPGVSVTPFHLSPQDVHLDERGLRERIGAGPDAQVGFVLLADPFTCDAPHLVAGLDRGYPNAPKVGGLASGGSRPGRHALFARDACHFEGAAGVALSGPVRLDTIVSQGCRPIGEPMIVTSSERNVIHRLDRGNPVRVLRDLYAALTEHDRALFERALHVGVETGGQRGPVYHSGDFLVRDIVEIDAEEGALSIGATLEHYQVIQFHVRDADTSDEELRKLLARYRDELGGARPAAGVLFSCLGRGVGLFGHPNHESDRIREALGDVPLGGFFGNGEIGPVAGRTFVHGYTSSLGLFRGA